MRMGFEPRVVLFTAPEILSGQLMAELAQHLPGIYMPSVAVTLPQLPTLPNGKLDRKLLEALARQKLQRHGGPWNKTSVDPPIAQATPAPHLAGGSAPQSAICLPPP